MTPDQQPDPPKAGPLPKRPKRSKIARLPPELRDALNERLQDGAYLKDLVIWLNGLPEVTAITRGHFAGKPIQSQNIARWKRTGYQAWLKDYERTADLRRLSEYSLSLAKAAGGSLAKGALAIAGGRILETIESAEDIGKLTQSLVAMRQMELSEARLAIQQQQQNISKDRLTLAQARYQRDTGGKLLELLESDAAKQIGACNDPAAVKIEQLLELMFGDSAIRNI